jgi:ACS family hexuronate transporter-like MFS transporter
MNCKFISERKRRPLEPPPPGRYRYRILALLFVATTINYMDRSVLGVLAPTLQYKVFHWSDKDYAAINIAFKTAYAIGLVSMGALVDRIGTRAGYALSISVWSCFGMMHALVRPAFSLVGFAVARFGLGLGESGNFPCAIKAAAEWFPKRERAFATGIFNAGANVGAILAPTLIPLFVRPDGRNWQFAFLGTGFLSLLWLVTWLRTYRTPSQHPRVSGAELAYIHSDAPARTGGRIAWRRILATKETWAFSMSKTTDAVWLFYLFWGGKYLFDRFGLDIKGLALPLIAIYGVSDLGSVFGGWLSSSLIKRGWTVNRARKTALLVSALMVLPVVLVTRIHTRFNVGERFFARIHEGGAPAVSGADEAALRGLAGQSYGSAREFAAALRSALPQPDYAGLEGRMLAAARSDQYYWFAVLLIALAAAGHQSWSCNLFTIVSDVFPRAATASVIGFGGMVGAVAGITSDWALGQVLGSSGPSGYLVAFLIGGFLYLFFLGVLQLMMPRLTPLDDDLRPVAHQP